VNKKKQKNFVTWSAPAEVGDLQVNKSFLLLLSDVKNPSDREIKRVFRYWLL